SREGSSISCSVRARAISSLTARSARQKASGVVPGTHAASNAPSTPTVVRTRSPARSSAGSRRASKWTRVPKRSNRTPRYAMSPRLVAQRGRRQTEADDTGEQRRPVQRDRTTMQPTELGSRGRVVAGRLHRGPQAPRPGVPGQGLATREALLHRMPEGNLGLAELPAEVDHLAVLLGRKVDQAEPDVLQVRAALRDLPHDPVELLDEHARRGPLAEEICRRDRLERDATRRRERPHLRLEPERTALQTLDPECELRHGGIRLLDAKELLRLHAEGMLAARSFAVEGSRALRHPCAPGTRALHTTGGAERRADDQAGRGTLAAARGTGRAAPGRFLESFPRGRGALGN